MEGTARRHHGAAAAAAAAAATAAAAASAAGTLSCSRTSAGVFYGQSCVFVVDHVNDALCYFMCFLGRDVFWGGCTLGHFTIYDIGLNLDSIMINKR